MKKGAGVGIGLIICFDNIVRAMYDGKPQASSLAARLADLPALILDHGLVPAVTFYLSKIDDDSKRKLLGKLYKKILEMCDDDGTRMRNGTINGLREDLNHDAYVSATALLLAALTKLGIINKPLGDDRDESVVREAAQKLLDLIDKRVDEDEVLEAVIEMKKVSTAFYKKKRSRR